MLVDPEAVPLFILRVPVRYYRRPPAYFGGWSANVAPRWGEHWGNSWSQRHSGWDRWNHGDVPARAPLPVYQRRYSGARYPAVSQQQAIRSQNDHSQLARPAPVPRMSMQQQRPAREQSNSQQRAVPQDRPTPQQRAVPQYQPSQQPRSVQQDRSSQQQRGSDQQNRAATRPSPPARESKPEGPRPQPQQQQKGGRREDDHGKQ